jgi:hypothetical protein
MLCEQHGNHSIPTHTLTFEVHHWFTTYTYYVSNPLLLFKALPTHELHGSPCNACPQLPAGGTAARWCCQPRAAGVCPTYPSARLAMADLQKQFIMTRQRQNHRSMQPTHLGCGDTSVAHPTLRLLHTCP